MVLKSLAATGVVLCLCVHSATAFDYSGLRSGMSYDEVGAASTRAGFPRLEPMPNRQGIFTLGSPFTSTVNMTFCQNRLFALTSTIQGGVDAFAQLTSEMVQRYGSPSVTPTSEYTESGLLSAIQMTWTVEGGETVSVNLTSYQGAVTVVRSYSAFDVLCAKP